MSSRQAALPSTGEDLRLNYLVESQTFLINWPEADKHASDRFGRPTGAIGARGAVTKTPRDWGLQNPANSGLPEPAPAVVEYTSENHRSGHNGVV